MTTTPTTALVEEAQSMTTDTLIEEAMGEMHRLGIDNLRAKGAIVLLVEALRRAEAERDESRRDAEAYKRQTQEVSAKAIELTKEVCAKLEQAEAERDAQRAEVLRLTGERDEAEKRRTLAEERLAPYLEWSCKTCGCTFGNKLTLADKILPAEECTTCFKNHVFVAQRDDALSKVAELTATRDLLTKENARLQERVATLELLRRGGK